MTFKAIWPTAPRDFIACTTWTELDDGSIMVATRSAPDELCPQVKGYVRGTIQLSGYWIQPHETLKGDPSVPPGHIKVTLTAHTELGGTLPVSVINMLATAAPLKLLSALGDLVKK
jgi:START domain